MRYKYMIVAARWGTLLWDGPYGDLINAEL